MSYSQKRRFRSFNLTQNMTWSTQLKVQDGQFKFRVGVQGKVVEKEIRVIVRGEFRYCSFREIDQDIFINISCHFA